MLLRPKHPLRTVLNPKINKMRLPWSAAKYPGIGDIAGHDSMRPRGHSAPLSEEQDRLTTGQGGRELKQVRSHDTSHSIHQYRSVMRNAF